MGNATDIDSRMPLIIVFLIFYYGSGKSTGNVKSSGVKLSFTLRIDASLASYRWEIDSKSSWVQFLITTWIDASLASYRREVDSQFSVNPRLSTIFWTATAQRNIT